jgi:phosphatidylserine/phosphatidylglycerophosphate/cardiolipin synthase-like enzyme
MEVTSMTEIGGTRRITTLEDHQTFLKDIIATAKKRVVIVSPFISSKAIKADNLSALIKQAVSRGVQVHILVDYKLNTIDGEMKHSAKKGIAELVNAGANVAIANGIHNKTLARDNNLIAEGSFNWLSAVRVKNAESQREERTLVITGESVAEIISQELERIRKVEYAYATPAKPLTRYPEAFKTLIVTASVLASVLFFSHGNVKWLTFWAFFVGLLPFVVAAIWRDTHPKSTASYSQTGDELYVDPFVDDDTFGYCPGVRDFSGGPVHH